MLLFSSKHIYAISIHQHPPPPMCLSRTINGYTVLESSRTINADTKPVATYYLIKSTLAKLSECAKGLSLLDGFNFEFVRISAYYP